MADTDPIVMHTGGRAPRAGGRPGDLFPVIPHLIGVHPHGMVVILGATDDPDDRIPLTITYSNLWKFKDRDYRAVAGHAADVLARNGIPGMIITAWDAQDYAQPALHAISDYARIAGIAVYDRFIAGGGLWARIVPGETHYYRPYYDHWDVPVLPYRRGLRPYASVDEAREAVSPRTDEKATSAKGDTIVAAVESATKKANRRMARLMSGTSSIVGLKVRAAGIAAVETALSQVRNGEPLGYDDAAWIAILLKTDPGLAAITTGQITGSDPADTTFFRLWQYVATHIDAGFLPVTQTLLAHAALHCGNPVVAIAAAGMALAYDDNYLPALTLRDQLRYGILPVRAKEPA